MTITKVSLMSSIGAEKMLIVRPTIEMNNEASITPLQLPVPNELLQPLLQDLANGKVYLNEKRKLVGPARRSHAKASWRRMYLTQPPITRVGVQCMFGFADGTFIGAREPIWQSSSFKDVADESEGLTGREIVKVMMKRQDQMEHRKTVCAEVLCAPLAPAEDPEEV